MSNPSAQTENHPLEESYSSPPATIVLTIIVLIFFSIGFFSFYFCRCIVRNLAYTWNLRGSPSGASPTVRPVAAATSGLDPSIIRSFPTFAYSAVKGFRRERYGLECAICLGEFGDDAILRLLTACCHVFHQECIDLWLESHNTCPVCRRALDKSPEIAPACDMADIDEEQEEEDEEKDEEEEEGYESIDDTFSIDINNDDDDDDERDMVTFPCKSDEKCFHGVQDKNSEYGNGNNSGNNEEKFPRSHSTGHSIARVRGEEDRFTLRLPEHVKRRIATGHRQTGSCITFGELSCKKYENVDKVRGLGEASGSAHGDANNV